MNCFRVLTAKLIVACLIVIAWFTIAPAAAQTTVIRTVSNGAEGDIDPGPCNADDFCLQFFQVTQTNMGVTLSFQFSTPDGQALFGIGVIPTSDFVVSPKQLVLNTDTSVDASATQFQNYICDFSGNCNPAEGGPLSFSWTQTSIASSTSNVTTVLRTALSSTLISGGRSSNSAAVIGSFNMSGYLTSFASGLLFGEIANNKNLQITVSR